MSSMSDTQIIAALKKTNLDQQEAIKNCLIDMSNGNYDSAESELRRVFSAPWISRRKK